MISLRQCKLGQLHFGGGGAAKAKYLLLDAGQKYISHKNNPTEYLFEFQFYCNKTIHCNKRFADKVKANIIN